MNIYNNYANTAVDELKLTFGQVREIGNKIKAYPNKLDKVFYLSIQDDLSTEYDLILEKYLTLKGKADEAEAVTMLAIKRQHDDNKDKVTQKVLEAEVLVEIKDILTGENVLESWVKITKNYLQTCRSHVTAITGREGDDSSN